ncbi:MAG: DUF192 domain-containing protein [Proteobacteria bacterium]|nr:DUF192 domain-containing protein [Pseudomonadota bacterium]MDA0983344.1 DUF192 domain-containing protein [Pseudomonadota bacterium]
MHTAVFAAALFLAAPVLAELPVVELGAGMHVIRAEVAADMASRTQGLMHRKSLPANGGMVFVFGEDAIHCMWMKNTLIPLAVAFIDRAGTIVSISEMQPHSEQTHCAAEPTRYALEMNKGWFAQKGIRPGAKLRGLEKLAPR